VRDFLVGPSAAPSNGSIADGRTKWRCPFQKVEKFEESAEESGRSCPTLTVGYQIGRINCGKASLLHRISEH